MALITRSILYVLTTSKGVICVPELKSCTDFGEANELVSNPTLKLRQKNLGQKNLTEMYRKNKLNLHDSIECRIKFGPQCGKASVFITVVIKAKVMLSGLAEVVGRNTWNHSGNSELRSLSDHQLCSRYSLVQLLSCTFTKSPGLPSACWDSSPV